jgi:hypothetical protein
MKVQETAFGEGLDFKYRHSKSENAYLLVLIFHFAHHYIEWLFARQGS